MSLGRCTSAPPGFSFWRGIEIVGGRVVLSKEELLIGRFCGPASPSRFCEIPFRHESP